MGGQPGKDRRMQNAAPQLPRRTKCTKKRVHPGEPPGTVRPQPDAAPSQVRLVRYSQESCDADLCPPGITVASLLQELRPDADGVTWIDISGFQDTTLIQGIGKRLQLHSLALEDAVSGHQRPKVDVYKDHLFVVAKAHLPGTVEFEQVAFFLKRNLVISLQENRADILAPVRNRIEADQGRIRQCGSDYLLYSLLDLVVDGYFPALEEYGERLDALDYRVSSKAEQSLINEIHGVRTELLSIRRAVWPLRDALNALVRDSGDLISNETSLYLRDCHDHMVQIIDIIETDRELCADLRDFFLSVTSNRMNQVMKFLTIIATLFIPLSFIAGLYGMNFNTQASRWNMPELNWPAGYPYVLGLMGATACGMLYFFWRKGWLG